MKFSLLLLIIVGAAAHCFSQTKPLEFGNGSRLLFPVSSVAVQKDFVDTEKIIRQQLIVVYRGLGRATAENPFGQFPENSAPVRATKLTKKQSRLLFGKIDRINTAYAFRQGANEFYLSGFNSINPRRLDTCRECKVKITLVILESKADGKLYYSPYIESIEK